MVNIGVKSLFVRHFLPDELYELDPFTNMLFFGTSSSLNGEQTKCIITVAEL